MVISEFVPKNTSRIISSAKRALKNIYKGEDEEALHDTRVAIRRIRSILRELRRVYDTYYIDIVRNQLKSFFNITGDLRDLEVSIEILSKLKISDTNLDAFTSYLNSLKEKEKSLRKEVIEKIDFKSLDDPAKTLQSLLNLPLKPEKDKSVEIFAFKKANKLRKSAIKMAVFVKEKIADSELSHDFRILFKRLRYTVEFFKTVLPPTYVKIARTAKKMQSLLGDIHDYDVLLVAIKKENELVTEELKQELVSLLGDKREKSRKDVLSAINTLSENI